MEVTDFATDTTNVYSELKRELALAVTNAKNNTAKNTYLDAVLDQAVVAATFGTKALVQYSEWVQDDDSDAFRNFKINLTNAISRNYDKLEADTVLFVAILQAGIDELAA